MFLEGYVFKMFLLNKESREKARFLFTNFELVVVFVVKLEIYHLIQFVGIVVSQKILTSKQVGVLGKLRVRKSGLV